LPSSDVNIILAAIFLLNERRIGERCFFQGDLYTLVGALKMPSTEAKLGGSDRLLDVEMALHKENSNIRTHAATEKKSTNIEETRGSSSKYFDEHHHPEIALS
jgi:hypothetical protein